MKLSELAELTGAHLENCQDVEISGGAGLDDAGLGEVTFLSNPRYTPRLRTTRASAVYLAEAVSAPEHLAVLRARDPYLAFTRALRILYPTPLLQHFVDPSAVIDNTSRIHPRVYIGAHVSIGHKVEIGEGVSIFANATIYDEVIIGAGSVIHSGAAVREKTVVGARVIIHNNAVIGSDGFGYARDEEKRWLKIPQTGRVVIEDDVEIGAGTTIDRASVGETRVGRGTKIDSMVQVGHSCTIGEDSLLCAQTGLAGSSRIGDRVILAGQVGIAGHLTVGNDAVITAKSATSHDVAPGKVISGIPAFDNREWLRAIAAFRRLGEMQKTIRKLEERVHSLESQAEKPR